MTLKLRLSLAGLGALKAAWSVYCVQRSLEALSTPPTPPEQLNSPPGKLFITLPLLNEGRRVPELTSHWRSLLDAASLGIEICFVTTEREGYTKSSEGPLTWKALQRDSDYAAMVDAGRARHLHYPRFNRTYAEQVGWSLNKLACSTEEPTHYYLTNVDSRLSLSAFQDVIRAWQRGTDLAQHSALFLAGLQDLSGPCAAEALYQSKWTLEPEYFRYLVGTGSIRWIPSFLSRRWYQHAVGHGLLISDRLLTSVGGLPNPTYGLEDSALGFRLRASGHAISPLPTLECGEAPATLAQLLRQRATWVRGPLCAPEHARTWQDTWLAAQGLYDGLKWSLGLPLVLFAGLTATPRTRALLLASWSLELYAPVIAMVRGLKAVNIHASCRLAYVHYSRALVWLPAAPVSYWAGGLVGLLRLLRDLTRRRPSVQPTTQGEL